MPSPTPIPKKVDELYDEVDEAITIDGSPEPVDSTDHNQLEKNIIASMKPQLLRVEQDGISTDIIDFTSNECFFFNLAGGNFTLNGFTNAMIGREIKLVVFGVNRFLFGAFAFAQIGSHQKGEQNICFVDCVPDQSGNPLYIFRWQNASNVNFNSSGSQEFEEDTNTQLLSILKHTNGVNQSVMQIKVKSDSTSSILIDEQNGTDVIIGDIGVSHGFSAVKPLIGGSAIVQSLAKDNGEAEIFAQSKNGNFTKIVSFETGTRIEVQKNGLPFVQMEASEDKGAMITLKGNYQGGAPQITTKNPYIAFDNGFNRRSHVGSMSGNIGDWNINSVQQFELNVPDVGFSLSEITSVEAIIGNDTGLEFYNICSFGAGLVRVENGDTPGDIKVVLEVQGNSFFDSTAFEDSPNRGRWIIHYGYETFG